MKTKQEMFEDIKHKMLNYDDYWGLAIYDLLSQGYEVDKLGYETAHCSGTSIMTTYTYNVSNAHENVNIGIYVKEWFDSDIWRGEILDIFEVVPEKEEVIVWKRKD